MARPACDHEAVSRTQSSARLSRLRRWTLLALVAATLVSAAAAAGAARSQILHADATIAIPAGDTRSLAVPYPDALEYGNAHYHGAWKVLGPPARASGRTPRTVEVTIIAAGPIEGGSLYRVRARNANAAGTAPIRLEVIATTTLPGR